MPRADLLRIGLQPVDAYQYINRGYMLLYMKLIDLAEKEALEALRLVPHSSPAYEILGRVALERKEYELAYQLFRQAKVLDPSDPLIRYYVALSLFRLGHVDKAEKLCNEILPALPKDPKPRMLLFELYLNQNNYLGAKKVLEELEVMRPAIEDELLEMSQSLTEKKESSKR